ncbi:SpcZ [Streptomyces sp900105755]|uniref:SpcZ n=1 Tax=Streptomyces sp. 900105755 TaxID=3154389 RepID=UPI00331D937F
MSTRSRISPDTVEASATPAWTVQVAGVLADEADACGGSPRPAADVPFAAVHLWHAGAVADLVGEAVARHGGDPAPHEALRVMHVRAAMGEAFGEDAWSVVLEPVLREMYLLAYPRERVHSRAAAAAASFALSRGWAEKDAKEYGETYARMNTEASERVYAEANTIANTAAHALAFATGEAEDYAHAWPSAVLRAWIAAYAGADATAGPAGQEARRRLRDGLDEAVRRASA